MCAMVRPGASLAPRRWRRAPANPWSALTCVKVYGFPSSPHCLKIRAVASEVGLNLEWVTVDILEADDAHGRFQGA